MYTCIMFYDRKNYICIVKSYQKSLKLDPGCVYTCYSVNLARKQLLPLLVLPKKNNQKGEDQWTMRSFQHFYIHVCRVTTTLGSHDHDQEWIARYRFLCPSLSVS